MSFRIGDRPMIHTLKIIILGGPGTGKTSLALRFAQDTFSETTTPTVLMHGYRKAIKLDGKPEINLEIVDPNTNETYQPITCQYFNGANYAIICFESTSKQYQAEVEKWVNTIRSKVETRGIIIASTKSDLLAADDQVSSMKAMEVSTKNGGIGGFCTSSKNNTNISELFSSIVNDFLSDKHFEPAPAPATITPAKVTFGLKK